MKDEWVERALLDHFNRYRSQLSAYEAKAFAKALERVWTAAGFKLLPREATGDVERVAKAIERASDNFYETAGADEAGDSAYYTKLGRAAIAAMHDAAPAAGGAA